MLEHVHADYVSIYENDFFLKFENGLLINYDFLKKIKPSDETEINPPHEKEAYRKINNLDPGLLKAPLINYY